MLAELGERRSEPATLVRLYLALCVRGLNIYGRQSVGARARLSGGFRGEAGRERREGGGGGRRAGGATVPTGYVGAAPTGFSGERRQKSAFC